MNVMVEPGHFVEVDAGVLQRAVVRTVEAEQRDLVEVSLTLLDDAEIQELNHTYLGHDRPTDVIAFALGDLSDLVGDIYLGVEQARRQAAEHGVPLPEELARLAIHGTLHLLGHDHPEGEERYRSPMFERQERILREVLDCAAR
ncbi:MAG: rRNA maturation RNase YbeY [Gemmatimonadota bacterium]